MLKIFLYVSLLSSFLLASPNWYTTQTYKSHNQTYYGYGEGSTQKEARSQASVEISEQIKVDVRSNFTAHTSQENSDTKHSVDNRVVSSSTAILKEMKVVQKSKEASRYYVALEYIYTTPTWYESRLVESPLFAKVGYGSSDNYATAIEDAKKDLYSQLGVTKLASIKPIKSEKIAENYFIAISFQNLPILTCKEKILKQNTFLAKSSLVQEANRLTSCEFAYQLHYINGSWYLQYETILEKLSSQDLNTFFVNTSSATFGIKSQKKTYTEGEGFLLQITSKKKGYISLFNVYENGKVGLIFDNKKIEEEGSFIFPSKKSGQEFVATLNVPNSPTIDLYIAFYTENKMELSYFENQSDRLVSSGEYKFDSLIKLSEYTDFATLVLRTKVQ